MCTAFSAEGEVQPSIKFSEREFAGKDRVMFLRGNSSLYIDKKLKSEIFNGKRFFKLKCFFLLYLTKNFN